MEYPYFKGLEADRYSFYRVPKALVKADLFQKMSGDAKLLYAVLLDRMSLSIKNGWQDKHGNTYIICTIEEVMDSIHCARQKAVKLLDELEQEFRLIERRRQGLGKPNLLYVKDLYAGLSQSNYWKYENHTSGGLKIELPGVPKSNGSNTEKINKTDNSETDLIYTVDCLTHKTKKNEGEVEQYFIPDHHPAIVEREIWDKAQVRLEQIAGKRRRIRPKQQRLVPLRKGVLLGFVPIRPTWKAVSFKRLETATEKVMALVDAKPEQVHIEYESEECEMEILKGFEVINLKQPKGESVMTVTSNSLKFNKATAVELNYAPYIKVLLNAKTRQIAIQPCSEKDPNAIKFSNEESKQTYAISIKVPAIQVEFRRMLPFEDDNGGKLSYTLNGTLCPDEQVVIYDIGDVKPETEKKRRGRRKKSEIEAEQKEN